MHRRNVSIPTSWLEPIEAYLSITSEKLATYLVRLIREDFARRGEKL